MYQLIWTDMWVWTNFFFLNFQSFSFFSCQANRHYKKLDLFQLTFFEGSQKTLEINAK